MMTKKIKGFNLKDTTIEMIERISEMNGDSFSRTVEDAVRFYARERYGLE